SSTTTTLSPTTTTLSSHSSSSVSTSASSTTSTTSATSTETTEQTTTSSTETVSSTSTSGIQIDTSNKESVCKAASIVIDDLLQYYSGNGEFLQPYYWWQYGVTFGSLLNYQHICGNDSLQTMIYKGMVAQVGSDWDYQPSTRDDIGNDDIGTWALVAIQAAEQGFTNPSDVDDSAPSWLEIAENSFRLLWSRWDTGTCNGGVRWQFEETDSGYSYKATIANANLFQLSARLARYTGNTTYVDVCDEMYDWIAGAGLVNPLEYGSEVYDGFHTTSNCTDLVKVMWTYNYGVLIGGSAYLYNLTEQEKWYHRTDSILTGSQILYNDTVLYERACEYYNTCNTDQTIFKGIYTRYIGVASQLIPKMQDRINGLIVPSALGAAQSCAGGDSGFECGMRWAIETGYDNNPGLGQQVNALEIFLNSVVNESGVPSKEN
ncbi:hypothetical protein WICPIJ_009609, partial [Wickerhamomyces pijperi]